nr:reverse transcriptase domain-containing protein [Tanacetum cinerariifolium]
MTTTEFTNYMKANNAILKNMQTNMTSLTNSNLELKNMFGQFMKMNTASSSGSGTLPSNTITNPKEDLKGITTRSGNAYKGPTIPTTFSPLKVVERETEVTKDTVPPTNNESTKDVQPPVIHIKLQYQIMSLLLSPLLLPRSYFPPTSTIPRRSRKQTTNVVEPEFRTIVEMADYRTMAQMLQAPIEGYEDAIVVPQINENNFELKQTLINLVQSNQFTGGNFLDKIPRECLSIIESKSKVRYSRSRITDPRANTNATLSFSLPSNSFDLQQIAASLEDKLDIRMNRFEKSLNDRKNSFVTPTAPIKAVEEVCVTCGANHRYNQCLLTRGNDLLVFHDNIQQFQAAAVGNFIQNRNQIVSNQMRPPGFNQPNQQNC